MPPMPVDVDTARRGGVVDAVRATGRIEALQAVELRSDEQGRVTELLFREGQAVAAGTNVTFKILYNSAVAMTGGQDAAGALDVPAMTRMLEAEGVRRVVVTTDDPAKYGRDARWASGVEVHHRDRLDELQRQLRDTPGVTVLIHDQRCAAEKRRLRKRGKLPDPAMRVFINEAVCEGCGDCGVKSNCVSVQPVETEFGRKTQVHQSSCNRDETCLDGECPSFVTFTPRSLKRRPRRAFEDVPLPEPVLRVPRDATVVMTGIGGTGVVTLNQVLGTAALLDGRHVRGLDQTGLSQKNGPVVSHLKISDAAPDFSNKVATGDADCFLALDVLVGTSASNLKCARPEKTIAVISTSEVATGAMVASRDVHFPDRGGLLATFNRVTRKDDNVVIDSVALAETLFDSHMMANPIMLGAAYQAGAIPVSAAAIEQAFALNGVAVEMNLQAFRWGRLYVQDRAMVERQLRELEVKRLRDADDGVLGGAVDGVVALPVGQEQRHVGLAEQGDASASEPLDRERVLGRDVVLVGGHAPGRRRAGDVERLLDRHRHAVQRAPDLAAGEGGIGFHGARSGGLGIHPDDRVQRRIEPLDPREIQVEQLQAADFFVPDHLGELRRRLERDLRHHFRSRSVAACEDPTIAPGFRQRTKKAGRYVRPASPYPGFRGVSVHPPFTPRAVRLGGRDQILHAKLLPLHGLDRVDIGQGTTCFLGNGEIEFTMSFGERCNVVL